jgi:DNA polymerase-3 subunit alpha
LGSNIYAVPCKTIKIRLIYIHLTAHSAYSLQEGLALPAELAQAAQADGMPALGLTDHRLLSGSVEFVMACQKAGIQPLLGLEIDLESGPLALLAMSLSGWSNLCALSSTLALHLEPERSCPLDLLAAHSQDLIALSGDQGDSTGRRLGPLRDIFPGCLYLTLQDPARALPLSHLGRKLSLPLVVTHPIYYLTPGQASLQRTLSAVRLNCSLERLPAKATAPPGAARLLSQR